MFEKNTKNIRHTYSLPIRYSNKVSVYSQPCMPIANIKWDIADYLLFSLFIGKSLLNYKLSRFPVAYIHLYIFWEGDLERDVVLSLLDY